MVIDDDKGGLDGLKGGMEFLWMGRLKLRQSDWLITISWVYSLRMNPLIDVIIPTYNRSHLVERAITSVLDQTYREFHLYVVNDGSTDQTESTLANYAEHPQITILKQENRGVSAARNLGIKHSKSPWIAFLDSDDEWLASKLQTQTDLVKERPHLRFIHSNEIWIRNGVRVNAKKKFDKSNHEIFKRSLETCLISPSTVMMKRELCMEHGLFDESFVICEDYDLWLKILAQEEVGFIPEDLIKKHGGHDDQLSTKYLAMDFWRIKSLIQLSDNHKLTPEMKFLVDEQIKNKVSILKAGYLKHQNTQGLNDLFALFPEEKKKDLL